MIEKPEIFGSKEIHQGWVEIRQDKLKLPNLDKLYDYDVVKIGPGVTILPFLDKDTLLLARQYRHPINESLLELIQGGIKKSESPEQAARRELLEETGHTADFIYLTSFYPLPTALDMKIHIFTAKNLKQVQEPENNPLETLELVKIPYSQVLEEVLSNKHKDSALALAMLYYESTKK